MMSFSGKYSTCARERDGEGEGEGEGEVEGEGEGEGEAEGEGEGEGESSTMRILAFLAKSVLDGWPAASSNFSG